MFIIYMAFMALMILGFITGLTFVLIKRVDKEQPKKQRILLRVKRVGLFVPLYLAMFYLAYQLLMGYFEKECAPNPEDVKVMKPQAEVITNYILENGIPESMENIVNLPYEWDKCERTSKNVEWCYFKIGEIDHSVRLYVLGDNIYLKTYNQKSETGVFTDIEKVDRYKWVVSEKSIPYSTKDDGICNPLRM